MDGRRVLLWRRSRRGSEAERLLRFLSWAVSGCRQEPPKSLVVNTVHPTITLRSRVNAFRSSVGSPSQFGASLPKMLVQGQDLERASATMRSPLVL
jgi:hypothetical protein